MQNMCEKKNTIQGFRLGNLNETLRMRKEKISD